MEIPALADLLDVQALDLEIDRLIHRRSSLPELQRYKATQERIDELTRELEVATTTLRDLDRDVDKAEGELEMLEAKLAEHETRLFAGGMSARETEHMRQEVESLRAQKSASEERVLGLLDRLDPARAGAAELEEQRTQLGAERDEIEAVITSAWRQIDAELARKEERKGEAVQPIPADLMELYESLRQSKEGVGVGRLEDSTCGGCHMILSPAEVVEANASDPPRCVHCRRILVT